MKGMNVHWFSINLIHWKQIVGLRGSLLVVFSAAMLWFLNLHKQIKRERDDLQLKIRLFEKKMYPAPSGI